MKWHVLVNYSHLSMPHEHIFEVMWAYAAAERALACEGKFWRLNSPQKQGNGGWVFTAWKGGNKRHKDATILVTPYDSNFKFGLGGDKL